jgi:hypothetical protein
MLGAAFLSVEEHKQLLMRAGFIEVANMHRSKKKLDLCWGS